MYKRCGFKIHSLSYLVSRFLLTLRRWHLNKTLRRHGGKLADTRGNNFPNRGNCQCEELEWSYVRSVGGGARRNAEAMGWITAMHREMRSRDTGVCSQCRDFGFYSGQHGEDLQCFDKMWHVLKYTQREPTDDCRGGGRLGDGWKVEGIRSTNW